MYWQTFAPWSFSIRFDNSGSPSTFNFFPLINGNLYPQTFPTHSVTYTNGSYGILKVDVSGGLLVIPGDFRLIVTDGTNYIGELQLFLVDWNPMNAVNLGLANLDTNVGSRGTANPGNPMDLTSGALAASLVSLFGTADTVDTGVSFGDFCKAVAAILAGQMNPIVGGAAFLNWAGTKTRVSMPVDGAGNRGPGSFDFSP